MSSPIARPVGPTRRAEIRTSAPAPDPRSRTVSPACRSATAVGTPQPSDALIAASGAPLSPLPAYREPPNTPAPSDGPKRATPDAAAVAAAAYLARTVSRPSSMVAAEVSDGV